MTMPELHELRDRDRDALGRRNPGHLTECPTCGLLVRRLDTQATKDEPASQVLVAPDPMTGCWSSPLWGYGSERVDGREPETSAELWVLQQSGRFLRFPAPIPPSVSGYRDHMLDCRYAAAERSSTS